MKYILLIILLIPCSVSAQKPWVYSTLPRQNGAIVFSDKTTVIPTMDEAELFHKLQAWAHIQDICKDATTGDYFVKAALKFHERHVKATCLLTVHSDGTMQLSNFDLTRHGNEFKTSGVDRALLNDRSRAHTFYNMLRFNAELFLSQTKDYLEKPYICQL